MGATDNEESQTACPTASAAVPTPPTVSTEALERVTVVVVTFDSRHCLDAQLPLLRACPHVIVVDNGSADGTPEAVRLALPHATLIALNRNLGFGAANNLALAQVATKFALLLNPDCSLNIQGLCALVARAQTFPDAAIVAPQLINAEGQCEINYRWPLTSWRSRGPGAEAVTCVGFVCGAAMLLRTQAIRQIGGFDERFFLYYEDDDLCLRVRQAGQTILIDPEIRAKHRSRGSVQGPRVLRAEWLRGYHHTRSKLLFFEKHTGLQAAQSLRRRVLLAALVGLPLRLLLPVPKHVARWLGRCTAAIVWKHG